MKGPTAIPVLDEIAYSAAARTIPCDLPCATAFMNTWKDTKKTAMLIAMQAIMKWTAPRDGTAMNAALTIPVAILETISNVAALLGLTIRPTIRLVTV